MPHAIESLAHDASHVESDELIDLDQDDAAGDYYLDEQERVAQHQLRAKHAPRKMRQARA